MFEPGDLNAVSYWSHLFMGSLGLIGALLALFMAKGSWRHKAGGWMFIAGAGVAATTALHFQFTRFAAPAGLSSVEAFIGISAALLALRRRTPAVFRGEVGLAVLNALLLAAFLPVATIASIRGVAPPFMVVNVALVPVVFLVGDIVYLRNRRPGVNLARHLSRMAWTLTIAVRAPLFELRDDFGLAPWTMGVPLVIPPLLLWIFRTKIGLGPFRPRPRVPEPA